MKLLGNYQKYKVIRNIKLSEVSSYQVIIRIINLLGNYQKYEVIRNMKLSEVSSYQVIIRNIKLLEI